MEWLDWALNDPHAVTYVSGKPTFSQIVQWINEGSPHRQHYSRPYGVIDGYYDGH